MALQPFEAKIFKPGKGIGFFISSSRLYFGSMVLILAVSLLFNAFNYENQEVFTAVFLVLGTTTLIGSIWGTYSFEKKNGKLKGVLKVTSEYIDIDGVMYAWSEISNISFSLYDIYGYDYEPNTYYRFRGGPRYSSGINNFIEFEHQLKTTKVQFQLHSLIQKEKLEKIVKYQFFNNIITLSRTYNGLHLSYEEIQNLKKEKAQYLQSNS